MANPTSSASQQSKIATDYCKRLAAISAAYVAYMECHRKHIVPKNLPPYTTYPNGYPMVGPCEHFCRVYVNGEPCGYRVTKTCSLIDHIERNHGVDSSLRPDGPHIPYLKWTMWMLPAFYIYLMRDEDYCGKLAWVTFDDDNGDVVQQKNGGEQKEEAKGAEAEVEKKQEIQNSDQKALGSEGEVMNDSVNEAETHFGSSKGGSDAQTMSDAEVAGPTQKRMRLDDQGHGFRPVKLQKIFEATQPGERTSVAENMAVELESDENTADDSAHMSAPEYYPRRQAQQQTSWSWEWYGQTITSLSDISTVELREMCEWQIIRVERAREEYAHDEFHTVRKAEADRMKQVSRELASRTDWEGMDEEDLGEDGLE